MVDSIHSGVMWSGIISVSPERNAGLQPAATGAQSCSYLPSLSRQPYCLVVSSEPNAGFVANNTPNAFLRTYRDR